jgi:hypothetical protein
MGELNDEEEGRPPRPPVSDYNVVTPPNPPSRSTGAVSVLGVDASRSGRPSTPQITDQPDIDSILADPGIQSEPQIVAFLAPDDEDNQQVEARIAQKVEERLRQQMEDGEVVVADEVHDESSTCCGLKKRTILLWGILSLLMTIGGVVGAVVSSSAQVPVAPTAVPILGDPLLEELRSLNVTSYQDISLFSDPMSPQSQALAWMKDDTIIMSPGRSTRDALQRYVLAVLFYSTNGPYWDWSQAYLSSKNVCSWNNGTETFGVYCRLDGESVDELVLSSNSLTGQFPWELALLTNLEIIHLHSNRVHGSIPSKLGKLISLKSLDIAGNQLIGTIPTELGDLVSLESLDIFDNSLTGTIPTELGQLVSLQYLEMYKNQMTGTIPTELGQLVSLESLVMYYNSLTGAIPT